MHSVETVFLVCIHYTNYLVGLIYRMTLDWVKMFTLEGGSIKPV